MVRISVPLRNKENCLIKNSFFLKYIHTEYLTELWQDAIIENEIRLKYSELEYRIKLALRRQSGGENRKR